MSWMAPTVTSNMFINRVSNFVAVRNCAHGLVYTRAKRLSLSCPRNPRSFASEDSQMESDERPGRSHRERDILSGPAPSPSCEKSWLMCATLTMTATSGGERVTETCTWEFQLIPLYNWKPSSERLRLPPIVSTWRSFIQKHNCTSSG